MAALALRQALAGASLVSDDELTDDWGDPNWMPERAALMRRYGPERHLHFPPHLQGLAAAIDRLYFSFQPMPWEKEWDEEARSRARIVAALRHRGRDAEGEDET